MTELRVEIPYCPQEYQKEIHFSPKRFKVVIIGRRGGKTELAVNEIIKRSMDDPGLYWIVAPTYKQVKSIVWERLKMLLKNDPYWKYNESELSAYHTLRNTKIELKGAENEDSLRGIGLKGAVLDECATMKRNVWPEIVRPMLADTKGWGMFISTPKGKNWLYDVYCQGGQDWQSWKHPTSVNKYIPPEEIEQMRKDMSERLFRQEIMAEFLSDDSGVFRNIRACTTGKFESPVTGRFYVMGVDLAKTQDFTVLTVMDSTTRHLVAWERFNDIKWIEQKIRIQQLANKYNNALCMVDSTGVGDPIYEDLCRSGVSCESFKFTNESKNRLIEQLVISLEQRLITFPEIDILLDELNCFEYELSDRGKVTYQAPEGKHDDCVISLGLANWAIRQYLYSAQSIILPELEYRDKQGRGERVNPIEEPISVGY